MTSGRTMSSSRLAAVMTDDQRRELMREFIDEVAGADADLKVTMEWTLETWLRWLKKRQQQPADNNLLTFRIEKEGVTNGKAQKETNSN